MTSFRASGVRVLLMGTGTYTAGGEDSRLSAIPAVHATLRDLGDVLVEHCGVDPQALQVVEDPATSQDMGLAVVAAAERASELLLVYYVGHGLVSDGGRLFLAAVETDQENLKLPFTALPYDDVRDLLMVQHTTVVVVLDCCFSGRAVGSLGSPTELDSELARYDGGFVLAAAGRDQIALAPPGGNHTAFTGELIRLIKQGDPDGPEQITLDAAAKYLARALPAKGFPRPRRMGSGHASELVLAPNSAYRRGPQRNLIDQGDNVPSNEVCPYPGLIAFHQDKAKWFFGRERLTDELVRTVATAMVSARCTAVIGASGAGKSSLLCAGLLPAIARGALPAPGASSWPTVMLTPTSKPLRSLVDGLAAAAGWDPDTIWEQTARDAARVVDTMRALLEERADRGDRRGARLVLVVDQLEELFTACQDHFERDRFVRVLGAAVNPPDGQPVAIVIFGLRSDFYGHAAEYAELRSALQDGQVLVGPMTSEELTATIRRPAEAVGLGVEPGLVELLVRDVGATESTMRHDAALPLLAHALRQTWEFREDRTLTVDGYVRTGGVRGALAKTAEDVFAALDPPGRRTAERLLIRLVQLGESTRDTRRTLDVPALCAGLLDADGVLEALTAARLVTIDRNVAQIAHEALIGAWDRLRRALETDRWRLLESQKLDAEADRWVRAGRDASFLLRGTRLAAARELLTSPDGSMNLTPLAEALLTDSAAQEAAMERGTRRRTKLARSLVAIAAVLAVLTGTAVFWGVASYQTERERLRVAASLQAAATSLALRATQPHEAMLLAVAAWRIAPTTEARGALLSTQSQPFAGVLSAHGGPNDQAVGLAVHPASGLLAVARQRSVELWTLSRRQRNLVAQLPAPGPMAQLALTPDGSKVVGANQTGTYLWDVPTGAPQDGPLPELAGSTSAIAIHPATGSIAVSIDKTIKWIDPGSRTVSRTLPIGPDHLSHLAYAPDGRTLVAVTEQTHRIVLLDALTGEVRTSIATGPATITSVAVQPGGSLLATATGDGTVRLWDLATASVVATLTGHSDATTALAFSPDGRRLATSGLDRTIRLWDIATRRQVGEPLTTYSDQVAALTFGPDAHTLISAGSDVVVWDLMHLPITAHAGPANAVTFRPGGRLLATAGQDRTVRMWNVAEREPVAILIGHTAAVQTAAFDSRGALLATGGDDRTIRTWDVETGKQVGPQLEGPPESARAIAFSPDGSMLAVTNEGTMLRVWDADRATPRDVAVGEDLNGRSRISFSADNSRLVAIDRESTVVYDPRSGGRLGRPEPAHTPPSATPTIKTGDRSVQATVGDDQLVRLWDSQNRLQATLHGHRDTVLDAAFSDDRHTLATVSRDGALMIWDTNPDRIAIEVCESLRTELTPHQWSTYITDLPYQTICSD